jgi:hypothetical protein
MRVSRHFDSLSNDLILITACHRITGNAHASRSDVAHLLAHWNLKSAGENIQGIVLSLNISQ